jgi:hypothetical protein
VVSIFAAEVPEALCEEIDWLLGRVIQMLGALIRRQGIFIPTGVLRS